MTVGRDGDLVLGDYVLGDVIGSGGFGAVHRARGPDGAAVAIKILHAEHADVDGAAARLEREAEVLRRLAHPSVVRVLATGRTGDARPYVVMELLEGEELGYHLSRRGRLSVDECLAILEPVCSAIAAVHAHGIVHRDLKASNVFLREDGGVTVVDFGIAKLRDAGVSFTASRQIVGTPAVMAPEQLCGGPVDARTDVYGLGALAFHMLTGELPFDADSATLLGDLHRYAQRQRPSQRAPVPPSIDPVVVRAMSTDPARRQATAADFWRELSAAALGRPRDDGELRPSVIVTLGFEPGRGASAAELPSLLRAREDLCARLGDAGFAVVARLGRGAILASLGPEALAAAHAAAAGLEPGHLSIREGEVAWAGERPVGGPALDLGVRPLTPGDAPNF